MGLQLQNLVGKQIKGTWQNTLLPSIFLLLENETLPWGEGQFDVCEEPSSGPQSVYPTLAEQCALASECLRILHWPLGSSLLVPWVDLALRVGSHL